MITPVARVNYTIPDDLHRRAKGEAGFLGLSLREFVIQALTEAVEKARAEREKRPEKR
jgi:predicted HicB family RNase H-like nuclease